MTDDDRELPFHERYLIEPSESGGVVVDLVSGNYYRVNPSAAAVCQVLLELGDLGDNRLATSRVAVKLNVTPELAADAVQKVTGALAAPGIRGRIQGAYHFIRENGEYSLWHGARRVLRVSSDLRIRLPSDEPPSLASSMELYVRAVAPKLLFCRGITVLHASACIARGELFAFAGLSGAGKTTTARAFLEAGAHLVSEDLVVISPQESPATVVLDAENAIRKWAWQTAERLLADPTASLETESIMAALDGSDRPLGHLLFLDRRRREGSSFQLRNLRADEALTTLMEHNFLGAIDRSACTTFFRSTVSILKAARASEVITPLGVSKLPEAATRFLTATAPDGI